MTKEQINKMCDYANKQVKNLSLYVWGGQGERLYDTSLGRLYEMETSKSNVRRIVDLVCKRLDNNFDLSNSLLFDCSGLVCKAMEFAGIVKKGYDNTANGIYKNCKIKDISKVKKGDFVFKINIEGRCTHIGICVDDNQTIIEAKGRDYGVCIGKLSSFDKAGVFNG